MTVIADSIRIDNPFAYFRVNFFLQIALLQGYTVIAMRSRTLLKIFALHVRIRVVVFEVVVMVLGLMVMEGFLCLVDEVPSEVRSSHTFRLVQVPLQQFVVVARSGLLYLR